MAESLSAPDGTLGRNNPVVNQILQQQVAAEMLSVLWAACEPHQRALLGMLAISERYGIDLNELLSTLAPEFPHSYRPWVHTLAVEVSLGATPLSVIQQFPELLPNSATVALQLAKANNTLPEMYGSILARRFDPAAEPEIGRRQILGGLSRAYCTLFTVLAVSVFILIKILPQIYEMLSEFELEPPVAVEVLAHYGNVSVFVLLPVFLLTALLLPILLPALVDFLRSWNPHRWQAMKWVASAERRRWLAWESSGGHDVSDPSRDRSDQRVDEQVENSALKEQARQALPGGPAAATANFLTRSEQRCLSATASLETRAWLLRWFAKHRQHRHVTRSIFLVRLLSGMIYVILGLIVLLVAVAIFSTLIGIINGLSEW